LIFDDIAEKHFVISKNTSHLTTSWTSIVPASIVPHQTKLET
jgi:hypothetical protein